MEMCDDSCQLWVTNWCESAWVQMTDPDNKSRMNIGCITQAPFGNAIWKLILCPIYRTLALERPYGWYDQHQNHFISLWVSLCDAGNNIFLFFFFQVTWRLLLSQAMESASWAFPHSAILSRWDADAPSTRVLEDGYKTSAMLRFTEEKCVLWASLTSTAERGEIVPPFIQLFIALNL